MNSNNNAGNAPSSSHANIIISDDGLVLTKSEINLASLSIDWWIDTGATVHICTNVSSFSFYQEVKERTVMMGNFSVANIYGVGTVDIRFTSGNTLRLQDVLHVPDVRQNLVCGVLLSRKGYKLVFESNNVVISRLCVFVGKCYVCDGLFKLNVVPCNNFTFNVMDYIVCNVDSYDM